MPTVVPPSPPANSEATGGLNIVGARVPVALGVLSGVPYELVVFLKGGRSIR